jgi:hypothetical protein
VKTFVNLQCKSEGEENVNTLICSRVLNGNRLSGLSSTGITEDVPLLVYCGACFSRNESEGLQPCSTDRHTRLKIANEFRKIPRKLIPRMGKDFQQQK